MMDVLIPSMYYGVPVLANREKKFDAEKAMHLMIKHNVKNTFMPPTALKLIKSSNTNLKVNLRSIGSGGVSFILINNRNLLVRISYHGEEIHLVSLSMNFMVKLKLIY